MALTHKETEEIIKNKTLRAASSTRTATKVIVMILIGALVITGGAYGVMTIIDNNAMTVSVSNGKNTGLSLSEYEDFYESTTRLDMKAPESMNAYTYPYFNISSQLLGKEGAHHADGFIAYSFFLKNVDVTRDCLFTLGIEVQKDTKNLAAALRIMVIESDLNNENEVNNVNIYSMVKTDGTAEYISYNDCVEDQVPITLEQLNDSYALLNTNVATPFMGEVYDEEGNDLGYFAMREQHKELKANTYRKYTIVMWLEGTDLQCDNNILGGRCSVKVEFALEEYSDPVVY